MNLNAVDRVQLKARNNKICIVNRDDRVVAVLSRKAAAVWQERLDTIVTAKVLAMVRRDRADGEGTEDYPVKAALWELPIVEVLHKNFPPQSGQKTITTPPA